MNLRNVDFKSTAKPRRARRFGWFVAQPPPRWARARTRKDFARFAASRWKLSRFRAGMRCEEGWLNAFTRRTQMNAVGKSVLAAIGIAAVVGGTLALRMKPEASASHAQLTPAKVV